MRLFVCTSTPPIPSWGGAMAFYRHFCERNDFQISVVTDNPQILDYSVPYEYTLIKHGALWNRLSRTRFSEFVHSWGHLMSPWGLSEQIVEQAENFGAEAIFTVAGSWSWMAIIASRLSRRLKIPLVGSFNDWWYYNLIRYPLFDPLIEYKFKQFYQQCDLALCTSEGMQESLGSHRNAIVLYPTGATMQSSSLEVSTIKKKEFIVAFGGNLGDWYGRMLEALVKQAEATDITFRFFGSNASWSPEFDAKMRANNTYQGQVSFERLCHEMYQVDALLLLMGFEESCAQIERTSFKTKFLDYLTFQKPILLWGPEYCSAVKIAQEFDSAEICTSPRTDDFLSTIIKVKQDGDRQKSLVQNASRMYEERFNPDIIHQLLVTNIRELTH